MCAAAPQTRRREGDEMNSQTSDSGSLSLCENGRKARHVHFAGHTPDFAGVCTGCGELLESGLVPTAPIWGNVRWLYGCRRCSNPVTECVVEDDVERLTAVPNEKVRSAFYITVFADKQGARLSMRKWKGDRGKLLRD